jgi:hypothetical protein
MISTLIILCEEKPILQKIRRKCWRQLTLADVNLDGTRVYRYAEAKSDAPIFVAWASLYHCIDVKKRIAKCSSWYNRGFIQKVFLWLRWIRLDVYTQKQDAIRHLDTSLEQCIPLLTAHIGVRHHPSKTQTSPKNATRFVWWTQRIDSHATTAP